MSTEKRTGKNRIPTWRHSIKQAAVNAATMHVLTIILAVVIVGALCVLGAGAIENGSFAEIVGIGQAAAADIG